jgi:uncharacterized protein DUF4038
MFTVAPSSTGPLQYAKGFLTQAITEIKTIPPTLVYSKLLYGDRVTPFYWSADTAWSAPGFEASVQTSNWNTYISDRASRGMNVVLVAPAATYAAFPAGRGPFKPDVNSCTGPVPNDCSTPNPTYWSSFDNLMSTANQSGIVPLIAGLLDPLDGGAPNVPYPFQRSAVAFSRFLAARLAGFEVLYSPGFDDSPKLLTVDGITLANVMNAVGSALKQASPNQLVTNHLNGRATCTDYEQFRPADWMTFFAFQSGHGIGLPAQADQGACPRAQDTAETSVQASLRRAWQMPWTLGTNAPSFTRQPPAYNAEGPYDDICLQTPTCTSCGANPPGWCHVYDPAYTSNFGATYVDVRYHNRQAAYESLLSGGFGFTYGVQEIGHWFFNLISFSSALNGPSVGDMTSVFQNFNTRAGMPSHRDWITNNGPDTADDGNFKKTLASDGSSLVLAYLPAGTTNTINIATSNLPGLGCPGSGWIYTWQHAQNNALVTGVQCSGTNPIVVTKPDAVNGNACATSPYSTQACDWVLQIQKTGSASVQAGGGESALDVWANLRSEDGTSAIEAALWRGPQRAEDSVVVSPFGSAFQQSPRASRIPGGYLVVWHADGLDGSMLGIFGQRLDHAAQPVGERFQINTTSLEDQRDPAIDSDPFGYSVVVWASNGQDGDLGGIYGRRFDREGRPVSAEFQINTTTAGHQEAPQVAYLPAGNFVVSWQTSPLGTAAGAVSFKVFSMDGHARSDEMRIPGQQGRVSRLIDVMVTPIGGFRVRWGLDGLDGSSHGLFAQEYSADGKPTGSN